MSTKISEDEQAVIVQRLTEAYGEHGLDWDGFKIRIPKQGEFFYAVKTPLADRITEYRKALDKANGQVTPLFERQVAMDNLITDVEGVSDLDAFKAHVQIRPVMAGTLAGLAMALCSAGIEPLKKG